ncbi:MAG: glycosyltransferase family 2 protein [Candidatus Woesearchaeota archaeon]|jgi:glycosyltransferase involved in cell wall biosynthesis|nr:glycosyltransferase family 2 protein [Candidatus Woesearchaeota archaeon]MDP7198343.1 glycosyltransferase family 2 protein [Candidatus Woesearchaeota archaeon]MDP7467445.1 glycosyltransferase family 2 protein [Candidatus Woesearchaeota archaeon]MDP7647672.1 glycosyltransferase family 2 protein [Candidatus Woesearchaeota archaeon]
MKLSIIIPVYNEEATLLDLLKRVEDVKLPVDKEIILVDDGSVDKSKEIMHKLSHKCFFHEKNQGKGAAVRTGMQHATGDIIVIQDADLEYNPEDFKHMLEPILEGRTSVVFGSRFKHPSHKPRHLFYYLGNVALTLFTNILFFSKVSDMETCYKMFRKEVLKDVPLHARSFDLEPELTAKILKRGHTIVEVPIEYHSRPVEEGKKITWMDGVKAAWYLLKYRIKD